MEAFFILIVIAIIGVLFIGSILGFVSSGRIAKLERQNRNLNMRLKALESGVPPVGRAVQDVASAPKAAPPEKAAPVSKPKPAQKPAPVAASAQTVTRRAPKPSEPKSTPKPKRSLEELIGGQWSVWVGGLALLVGAVLLIRFSIEAGIFGPGARLLMATALGAVLLGAGEWLKRADDKTLSGRLGDATKALRANASIPALLSAVGVFTWLGTAFAAHELYGFINAPVAFALMGLISVGAMALSLRQGPILAAIGLLASMATPLLIQTDTPNVIALYGYLLIVGVAALVLAARTQWRWLETGVVAAWLGWSVLSIEAAQTTHLPLWSLFLAIGFTVTVWRAEAAAQSETDGKGLDGVALRPELALFWGAIAAILVSIVTADLHVFVEGLPLRAVILGGASIAALMVASQVFKRQSFHLFTAGVLALVLAVQCYTHTNRAIFASAMAVIVALALWRAFSHRATNNKLGFIWAGFAIALALIGIVAIEGIATGQWSDTVNMAWSGAYVLVIAGASFLFHRRGATAPLVALLFCGAGLAWVLASLFGFNKLDLSLVLSLGAALAALVVIFLRLSGGRVVLLGLSGLVFAQALLDRFDDAEAISARPILNELWVYLALPTAILGATAFWLHRRKTAKDWGHRLNAVIEAAALAGFALFIVFQIRHLSNGGNVYASELGFAELGLQVSTGLCFTLAGLSRRFASNVVLSTIAQIISYATLAAFAVGSLLGLSPLFNRAETVDGTLLFNSLTTGLIVPTILLALCAWRARGRRSETYVNILGGLSLAGLVSWVTAQIRFGFVGNNIQIFRTDFSAMELWSISAAWLLLGVALLVAGVMRRDQALRIASGVVIILTVLKAFLIDMAGLEGVLRALSFVGLGLVLIVIGRAYQKFWLSNGTTDQPGEIGEIAEQK